MDEVLEMTENGEACAHTTIILYDIIRGIRQITHKMNLVR